MHMNISIVGRLESFEEDWASISELLVGQPIPYDYNTGTHPTSANYPVDKLSGSNVCLLFFSYLYAHR